MAKKKKAGRTGITGVMHTNINCSDFKRSKVFYEKLGFQVIMKVAGEGSEEVSAAVGMPPYLVEGALMAQKDGTVIDLLQWKRPTDDAPPYDHLYHLGIARVALHTKSLDSDMEMLKSEGVEFLSEPVKVPGIMGSWSRFVCFKDPDGTILELVETDPAMNFFRNLTKLLGRSVKH